MKGEEKPGGPDGGEAPRGEVTQLTAGSARTDPGQAPSHP